MIASCRTCGEPLYLSACLDCARRAANDPDFAASEAGQEALQAAARVAAIARRNASCPTWAETSSGYRADMIAAGRGRLLP